MPLRSCGGPIHGKEIDCGNLIFLDSQPRRERADCFPVRALDRDPPSRARGRGTSPTAPATHPLISWRIGSSVNRCRAAESRMASITDKRPGGKDRSHTGHPGQAGRAIRKNALVPSGTVINSSGFPSAITPTATTRDPFARPVPAREQTKAHAGWSEISVQRPKALIQITQQLKVRTFRA